MIYHQICMHACMSTKTISQFKDCAYMQKSNMHYLNEANDYAFKKHCECEWLVEPEQIHIE